MPRIEGEHCDHIDLSHSGIGFLYPYFSFLVVFNMNYNFTCERRVTALSYVIRGGRASGSNPGDPAIVMALAGF